jgi:diguanylate cyclase (GGDEF)-like protein
MTAPAPQSALPAHPGGVRGWPLWRTPPRPLAIILAVEVLAFAGVIGALYAERVASADLVRFGVLVALAAVYGEGADRVDRLRLYLSGPAGLSSAAMGLWSFAAALVLPIGLAGTFAVLVHAHTLWRVVRQRSGQPFRLIYTAATEVLAVLAASGVVMALVPGRAVMSGGWLGAVGVLLAMAVYPLINQSLVSGVVYLVIRPARLRDVMLNTDDQALELAILCLAVLLAETLLHAPAAAPLCLVLIVVLRRSSLVRALEQQAMRDTKTGVLNASAWRQQADQELARAARYSAPVTVMMIDLDNFKQLNDRHGHLAGDVTLRAVADCIATSLRGSDIVGRYGGEEFVALLPEIDQLGGMAAAERLCERIRELVLDHGGQVTASIGLCTAEASSAEVTLDSLLGAADASMYEAKRDGRDRVGDPRSWAGDRTTVAA